jgi:hypothetical protein
VVEDVHGGTQRLPGGQLGRLVAYAPHERAEALLVAVEEGVLLAGEVVAERAARDVGRVGDGLDGDVVEAVFEGEPERCLVNRLAGLGLLALTQPWRAAHDGKKSTRREYMPSAQSFPMCM